MLGKKIKIFFKQLFSKKNFTEIRRQKEKEKWQKMWEKMRVVGKKL